MSAVVERRGSRLIGDDGVARLLLQHHLLAPTLVERCFEEAVERGGFLEEVLLEKGLIDAQELRQALESHHYCPAVDLSKPPWEPELLALVPRQLAARHLALPVGVEGDTLRIAVAEPDSPRVLEELEEATGRAVRPAVALRHELRQAVEALYEKLGDRVPRTSPRVVRRPAEEGDADERTAPAERARRRDGGPRPRASEKRDQVTFAGHDAVRVVDELVASAVLQGATDVHVEPAETELVIRLRVDGILRRVARLPRDLVGPVVSRLKVIGSMDIAERRVPQDGRATIGEGDQAVDVRVSSLPSRFGEKIVLRLLRKDTSLLSIDKLDMPDGVREAHRDMLESAMGLFLVTGPTGSGKTTTLYATLNALDRDTKSIVTLEDPIEYGLDGITQVQVNEGAGMTFGAGLRSILRQDPDVILVGEIRDVETVEIACRAALTGHVVFSTLHANDACQAVTRLSEMGVSPHLLTATLRSSFAQRLLRRNCEKCREKHEPTETERRLLAPVEVEHAWRGAGCDACNGSGYRGRMAVFEAFRMEDELHRLILDRAGPTVLRQAAQSRGMTTMLDDGRRAVAEGHTTAAEVQRVLLSEDSASSPCPSCSQPVGTDFSVCPFCQHVLHETCEGCGAGIESAWSACPQCGHEVERRLETHQCSRCAAELQAGWASCPFCGEDAT